MCTKSEAGGKFTINWMLVSASTVRYQSEEPSLGRRVAREVYIEKSVEGEEKYFSSGGIFLAAWWNIS